MAIEVGDLVKLKQTEIGASMGITPRKKRGGEARVIAVREDDKGPLYDVEILKTQRRRTVRRDDLVVHRKDHKQYRRRHP
jgi:hypothetical protein